MEDNYIEVEEFESNFAQVPKFALMDKNISLKAMGLYAFLFALPKGWKVYRTQLGQHISDGKDSLNSAFKELEIFGYIQSTAIRDNGMFKGYKLKLLVKSMYNTDEITPLRKNRHGETVHGKPGSGKSAPINTNSSNTDNSNKSLPNGKDFVSDLFSGEGFVEKKKERVIFKKPQIFEIQDYFDQLGYIQLSTEFQDHYISNGWMVGKTKMADWKAAARNWVKRYTERIAELATKTTKINTIAQMQENYHNI